MVLHTVVDALGREVTLPRFPQRIVSLVPSLTEWLFALGLDERVVGVTDFCVRPAHRVAAKLKLRGTKNPDRATIIALAPDLIIANKEENRERDVVVLTAAGIPVYVTDPCTVAAAINTLAALAELLDAVEAAAPYLQEMHATYRMVLESPPTIPPRVLVPIWRDPWMAIGAETYAHDLLQVCGVTNVAAQLPGRYPRFELATIDELRPNHILLPSEPYAFSHADVPVIAAVYDGQIDFVDGELLTWYGPRIPEALRFFHSLWK
jgi:ABC-type Fe3+-hydroxamate transport system substrate-binding protein